jgi:23S rRNA (pseudouridine1915-N3)-methyltransferase
MKIQILAVSHRAPQWAQEACEEYLKRFGADMKVAVQDLKPAQRGANGTAKRWMQQEAQVLLLALPAKKHLVILDERGDDLSSVALATRLNRWRDLGQDIYIIIGGPDGLDDSIKQTADEKIRLSSLTLPHALVKVLLLEQLFRADSILANHPYHRA